MTKNLLWMAAAWLMLASCGPVERPPRMITIRGVVFGTYYTITYFDQEGRVFQEEIDSLFADFNRSLSFYDPESLLSRINRNEETLTDDYFRTVFLRSMEISEETSGAFDATVFPLTSAWGFGYLEAADIEPEKVDSLLEFVGYQKAGLENGHVVKQDPRVQFDFNAIAKGYAADVIGRYLDAQHIDSYMVEIGGDLVAGGAKPDGSKWRIGLEVPAEKAGDLQEWHYFVEVENTGLATSGDYRRYRIVDGQRVSHTIDPATGYPVQHRLMSVSVFAPDAMSADAYATAFMVMGLDDALAFVEDRAHLEGYFIFFDNGRYGHHISSGLELFSREEL